MNLGRLTFLAAAVTFAARAQESRLSASVPSWHGLEVRFLTKIEPPGDDPRTYLPGGVIPGSERVHHTIQDTPNKRYFGYDLRLEPSSDGTEVQLTIEPLTALSPPPGFTLVPLPRYPVIPKVRVGDTVALDLLVNRSSGQKIVDYLTVRRNDVSTAGPEAHDFTLADVELFLDRPRVQIDGKLIEATVHYQTSISAPVVWFYLAGRGRYLVSLFPHEKLGFQKNGTALASGMIVRDSASEIRLDCRSPIAPGSGSYHLYVLHEPGWKSGNESFTTGGADKAEYLVAKH